MEEDFWKSINEKEIEENFLKDFDKIFREKIIKMSYVICEYFQNDNPNSTRFFSDPDDCYDGIHMTSNELLKLMYGIILSGKEKFNQFCENPFEGDIMSYLKRDVSCGNSSCLYFHKISFNRLFIARLTDNIDTYYPDDVAFLNQIFDIVIKPYL